MTPVRRALLSVYDKSGIVDFARTLVDCGVTLISTGGTFGVLQKAGLPVTRVQSITGFPEMLDGRVKTLHPMIHAGLLARRDLDGHMRQIAEQGIPPIDLLVINLYPFEQTIATDATDSECIEQIDIGGPAMLRSAAKNHAAVTVICDPDDYDGVAQAIRTDGGTSDALRRLLATKVFAVTAQYDHVIASWLNERTETKEQIPERLLLSSPMQQELRYGENPHQPAALYGSFLDAFEKLHGKELSYNNIVDIDAAAALIEEFDTPAVAIIKHTNPCGCAIGETLASAYQAALSTDRSSAFGGIVACNREVDIQLAKTLNEMFYEVIIAPTFADDAIDILRQKRDRRLIRLRRSAPSPQATLQVKSVRNGYLCQMTDSEPENPSGWELVTKREPTAEEQTALAFAWRVVKHVKSNAVVYTNTRQTLGIGAGQMSRVDASTIAVMKAAQAGFSLKHSVVASDAFFPFADGLLEAVKAGATAVIQPGGSIRDEEVISAADTHGIAMVFTGRRHFKH